MSDGAGEAQGWPETSQIALPLATLTGPERILVAPANQPVLAAFAAAGDWPFHTAVLTGPPRSGKSLLARWFVDRGMGEAIDNAEQVSEAALFHRWNRAQQNGDPLLLVNGSGCGGWRVALPDLASRIGAALRLDIGPPDDGLLAALAGQHAERRGLILGEGALAWLLPRVERSYAALEQVIEVADRLSLERQQPVTISLLRDALGGSDGERQPRLL